MKKQYPANWSLIADHVKAEAGWHCIRCGHANDPKTGHILTVHHLDRNPTNCIWWNLVALCQRCHLHIQGKVHLEQAWMFPHTPWFHLHVAGYYARSFGFPDDRRTVTQHLTTLLALGQGHITKDKASAIIFHTHHHDVDHQQFS